MKVLIACEFSGIVRDAFIALGHNAWSCDLLPTEKPGPHLEMSVLHVLEHDPEWDMMIAHPPCTMLTRSGARWWKGREKEQQASLDFVKSLMDAPIGRICIENPPGKIGTAIRKADQTIQPWQFGHGETKATSFWLKNLPFLRQTNIVEGREPRVHWAKPGPDRWKERSRTLPGIAAAMASQWGALGPYQASPNPRS